MIYQGKRYWPTGKRGTNIATGLSVSEYESDDASRIWVHVGPGQVEVFPD